MDPEGSVGLVPHLWCTRCLHGGLCRVSCMAAGLASSCHWASFPACVSLSLHPCAQGENSYAMAFHEALKKQLMGNNYLNMTPHSVRKDTLFTEGPSLGPLRLIGVWSLSLTGTGCGAKSLAMKPLQPQLFGEKSDRSQQVCTQSICFPLLCIRFPSITCRNPSGPNYQWDERFFSL